MKDKVVSKAGAQRRILRARSNKGLLYGGLVGLLVSLALWGYDSLVLSGISADLPALKFLAGALLLVLIGCLAGWLTGRSNQIWQAAVIWLFVGLSAALIALRMPFEGVSYLIGLLEPDFRGMDIYPYVSLERVSPLTITILLGLVTTALGVMLRIALDQAMNGSKRMLWLAAVLFLPLGLLADYLINEPLRQPLIIVDQQIKSEIASQTTASAQDETEELDFLVREALGEQFENPNRLVRGVYTKDEVSVYLDFDSVWGYCTVAGQVAEACGTSLNRYVRPFVCVLAGGAEEECKIRLVPGSEESLESLRAQAIGADVQFSVLSQRGTVINLEVIVDQNQHTLCRLRDVQQVLFERCIPRSQ